MLSFVRNCDPRLLAKAMDNKEICGETDAAGLTPFAPGILEFTLGISSVSGTYANTQP